MAQAPAQPPSQTPSSSSCGTAPTTPATTTTAAEAEGPAAQQLPQQQQFPTTTTPGYRFPTDKLLARQTQNGKTPLVLVACGSFSPITYLHLRMFEMARDYIRLNTNFEVVGGYISPVSDAYKKVGLAPAHHRINMCNLSLGSSSWIMVDEYETSVRNPTTNEPEYVPTAQVLAKLDHEINTVRGGIQSADDPARRERARICLLAGGDLVLTMSTPGLWAPSDLDVILGPRFGAFIVERSGTDTEEALASLQQYKDNIWVIPQVIQNDVSSTKIRLFLKKNLSIRYLIPDPVVRYIEEHGLFEGEFSSAKPPTPGPSSLSADYSRADSPAPPPLSPLTAADGSASSRPSSAAPSEEGPPGTT